MARRVCCCCRPAVRYVRLLGACRRSAQESQYPFRLCEHAGLNPARRENLRRGSHPAVGNHIHTAQSSLSAKIYYRFHPDFGKEVTIVRRFRIMAGNNVQIRLPDGSQLALPEWMLDEQACQEIHERDHPCIAVSALNHLRRLLSAQRLLQRARGSVMGSILPQQGAHEQIQTTAKHSVSAGRVDTESALGAAGEMRRASQPDDSGGGANEISGKRGGTR